VVAKKRIALALLLVLMGTGVYAALFVAPPGPRSLRAFDPDRTADLEVDMWRVYYNHDDTRLFVDLVTLLHEENRYPWGQAVIAGFYLARAASTFSESHTGYELLLPDLQATYTVARDWTHASFDPADVAKAELKWWVARRIPTESSPEHVGGLIADENAMLYGVPRDKVLAASILRARAGKLRDDGDDNTDWTAISDLLHQSYRQLHAAVAQ
jgi:hypothetical protein